jgi:Protein of unknown function (DUF3592)
MPITMRPKRRSPIGGAIALGFLGLVCILVGIGLGWNGTDEMHEAERIQVGKSAPATIVSITPIERRGNKGRKSYRFSMTYTFEYEGRTYQGKRFRVDQYSTSSQSRRDQVIADLQANPNLTAHFEANAPDRAVLDPAITKRDAMKTVIGAAVAFLGLGFWIGGGRAKFYDPALPIRTRATDDGYLIRAASTRRNSIATIAVIGGISCLAIAAWLAISATPIKSAAVLIAVAVGAGAFVLGAVATFVLCRSGVGDIEILTRESAMLLHPTFGRGGPERIALEDIDDITVVNAIVKGKVTDKHATFYPTLAIATDIPGQSKAIALNRFTHNRADAEELIGWLREQAALPVADFMPQE